MACSFTPRIGTNTVGAGVRGVRHHHLLITTLSLSPPHPYFQALAVWVTTISAEWMQLQHRNTQKAVNDHNALEGAVGAAAPVGAAGANYVRSVQHQVVGGMQQGGLSGISIAAHQQ